MWAGWACRWGPRYAVARNTPPTSGFAVRGRWTRFLPNFFGDTPYGRPHAGRRTGSRDLPTAIGENLFRCAIP
jgi:hypothetical protein